MLLAAPGASAVDSERATRVREIRDELLRADAAAAEQRIEDASALYSRARAGAIELSESNLLLARALDGLGDVERCGGRFDEATEYYDRSAAMFASLLGERQPRLATTLHNLGLTQLALGRVADGRRSLEHALEIYESTLGPESPQANNTRRALSNAVTAAASARGCPRNARPGPARGPDPGSR